MRSKYTSAPISLEEIGSSCCPEYFSSTVCAYSLASHRSTPEKELPSFARPTRASRLRESSASPSNRSSTPGTNLTSSSVTSDDAMHTRRVTIKGKPHIYKNGKLTLGTPGYLLSTRSAINKFGDNERRREKASGVCHPEFARKLGWGSSSTTTSVSDVSEQPIQSAHVDNKPTQIISQV